MSKSKGDIANKMIMRTLIPGLFLIFLIPIYAQPQEGFFLDEFYVSMNRIFQPKYNPQNVGYGLGTGHTFRKEKSTNLFWGIEYNRTAQYYDRLSGGRFGHYENMSFTFHLIKIPIILRQNFGNNVKGFIDVGFFVDLPLYIHEEGIYKYYRPDSNYHLVTGETEVDGPSSIKGTNAGLLMGVGVMIPVEAKWIYIKIDYHYGFQKLYEYYSVEIKNDFIRIILGLKI